MDAFFPRIPLNVPNIATEDLPAAEREAAAQLNREIQKLKKFADDFCDALILFDFSHHNAEQSTHDFAEFFFKWKLLAARDGAMTIERFANALVSAVGLLSQCNRLMKVDRARLRSSRKMLATLLPEFETVRNAAIRTGELMNDLDPAERHSGFTPRRLNGAEQGVLRNRKYQNVSDGKLQSYQVNRSTYEGLIGVANEFCSALIAYRDSDLAPQSTSPQPPDRFVWWVRPD
jgi:hypothetical protein